MRTCFILVFCLLLTGCGNSYTVTVDSLRDQVATKEAGMSYCMLPADDTAEDDLLFREVKRMLSPAFFARGFQYVDSCDTADAVVLVSYEAGAPEVQITTSTRSRYVPVVTRHRGEKRVDHVWVEEPEISSSTLYTAHMLLEGRQWQDGEPGRSLWRTAVHSSSYTEGFRAHLEAMAQVLRMTLATHMSGQQMYSVEIDDNGNVSVSQ